MPNIFNGKISWSMIHPRTWKKNKRPCLHHWNENCKKLNCTHFQLMQRCPKERRYSSSSYWRTRPQNCHNAFRFPDMAGGMNSSHTCLSYVNQWQTLLCKATKLHILQILVWQVWQILFEHVEKMTGAYPQPPGSERAELNCCVWHTVPCLRRSGRWSLQGCLLWLSRAC